MRILVYDSSLKVRDSIISILITAGYDVFVVKDKNRILNMFGKLPFSVAILEANEEDNEMTNILERIYFDDRYKYVNVIVHINEPSKDFISNMIKINVSGFLFKPFNEKDFLKRFELILDKANLKPKKLKHIVINNLDNIKIIFRYDNLKQMLHGIITEMSPIGLKFIIQEEGVNMDIDYIIKNVSMSISSYKINFFLKIINKIGNEYICEFQDLTSFNSKLICKFIYDKYIDSIK